MAGFTPYEHVVSDEIRPYVGESVSSPPAKSQPDETQKKPAKRRIEPPAPKAISPPKAAKMTLASTPRKASDFKQKERARFDVPSETETEVESSDASHTPSFLPVNGSLALTTRSRQELSNSPLFRGLDSPSKSQNQRSNRPSALINTYSEHVGLKPVRIPTERHRPPPAHKAKVSGIENVPRAPRSLLDSPLISKEPKPSALTAQAQSERFRESLDIRGHFSLPIVYVLVGQGLEIFPLHSRLLCHRSRFFRNVFGERAEAPRACEARLMDVEVDTFRNWTILAYGNKSLEQYNSKALHELYYLAERLESPTLQDLVMDGIRDEYKATQGWPSPSQAGSVYENTNVSSPLRRFTVACVHFRLRQHGGNPQDYFEGSSRVSDFIRDYGRIVQEKANERRRMDPRLEEDCLYYCHKV